MSPIATDCDVVVVGAGIVGLATADAIGRQMPGIDLVVLDKEAGPAQHQTGHNSGVVHSGLYYTPGSAKARLVARGRAQLTSRCRAWDLPIDWCGKVVVASRVQELRALDSLQQRGIDNGIEVRRITPRELNRLEPHSAGVAALHVPGAGIVDYSAVADALAGDVVAAGNTIRVRAEVTSVEQLPHDAGLRLGVGRDRLTTRWLVNCAGLQSDRVARLAGAATDVTIVPFRGEYHELVDTARHLVRGLIYPVPDPRWPFLGVHMTRMMDHGVHVGPNAVLAFGREAYHGGIDVVDCREMAGSAALRRLAANYWRTGAAELIRSRSSRLLLRDVQRLVPEIQGADMIPATAGIRAQAVAGDGTLLDDFAFSNSHRAVHVLNAPSPAATASLAIGEVVAERLIRLMAPG